MTKVADLYGHSSRVLHLAMSPDGETVVSGAADENLKFWKIFEAAAAAAPDNNAMTTNNSLSKSASPASKLESKLRKVIR